jgi:hypothetical protein
VKVLRQGYLLAAGRLDAISENIFAPFGRGVQISSDMAWGRNVIVRNDTVTPASQLTLRQSLVPCALGG